MHHRWTFPITGDNRKTWEDVWEERVDSKVIGWSRKIELSAKARGVKEPG